MGDIFDKVGKTISETGKVVGDKAKMVGEIARLNAKILGRERAIGDNYTVIGKFYYETYKDNPEEGAAEAVGNITAAFEAIADMKTQLRTLKGMIKCAKCGVDSPIDNDYCGKCGAFIEKPVIAEDLEEDDEIVEAKPIEEMVEELDD